MNKANWKAGIILFLTLLISGCYNNSHVRTQRVLEPGQKVISGSSSLAFVGPMDFDGSDFIDETGVSGARIGLSYLTLQKGYEQGVSVGYGLLESTSSWMLGYDIRKVQPNANDKLYRYGFYAEMNRTQNSGDYSRLKKGTVFQFRPYVMSVTSEQDTWYGGVHGLISFGDIQATSYEFDYTYGPEVESEYHYSYSVTAIGGGFTVGKEARFGNFLIQNQLDVSLVSQNHKLVNAPQFGEDLGFDPIENLGPVVSVGAAIHFSPRADYLPTGYPTVSSSLPVIDLEQGMTAKKVSYDPFTGQAIRVESRDLVLNYDPITGEPIAPKVSIAYDPITGEIIPPKQDLQFDAETGLSLPETPRSQQTPVELLSVAEKTLLLQNGFRVGLLNGAMVNAKVLDITHEGLLIYRESYGKPIRETIAYTKIRGIRFDGKYGGISGGLSSALAGCGLGVAIPLGLGIIGDSDMIFLSILTAPIGTLGGFIYGASKRDKYSINFKPVKAGVDETEYRRNIILHVTKVYLKTGSFPKIDFTKSAVGVKP